ncbi:uncharacterized protein LOC127862261 [Dreissena polymorpha]|uniref:Uncharacterized protein n=1 Tax=Dreissena polymorpha TaxID=45954 RepID=A0A9D3Y8T8_DREPO|nr:uncharacterized protein LOC127862261 [Dreissena polymorpha]KAH3695998.1 hypothetical protein DPMN_083462 [Dreissena polymorpha]
MMDLTRNLRFRIDTAENDSIIAYVEQRPSEYDNIGALYYVVAVVLIYGLSIVMMIASHIRRNKQDGQLRSYLKEMAALRKKNRREQLLEKMTTLATKTGYVNSPNKTQETSFTDAKNTNGLKPGTPSYSRIPSDDLDESTREISKASYSDTDSVFQFNPDALTPKTESPKTPRISPSKLLTPKMNRADGRPFFQVINENAPL